MQALLLIIFLVLIAVGIIIMVFTNIKAKMSGSNKVVGTSVGLAVSIISLVLLVWLPFSFHNVDTGSVAVVKVWGVAKETKTAGVHFDNWISTSYAYYDLKTQEISEDINAYSLDAQTMDSTLTVQFRIQEDKAIEINRLYGTLEQLASKIRALAIAKAKAVLSGQSAMDIISTRSALSAKLETAIGESIKPYFVDLTLVVITNIDFSDAFEKVVEDKMIAEQEQLKAEYEKKKAIIKAEEQLAVAEKEAEAAVARAKGDAQAKIEEARAQAERIRLKSLETARMLGFKILTDAENKETIDFEGKTDAEIKVISDYLKYIEYLEKWDGILPGVVGGDNTILVPKP